MSLHSDQPHWRLIVPVRGGALGKSRLTSIEGHPLTEPDRRDLMMAMAADTVAAAVASGCGPVGVLTADGLVADLARSLGADVVIDQGRGLNPELYAALAPVAPASGVAVLLGDLPAARAEEVREVLRQAESVRGAYVSDWEGVGTALVAYAPGLAERAFAFGLGSTQRHRELGLTPVGVGLPGIRCDVDTPAAWERSVGLGLGAATSAVRARLLGLP